ncbi:MAG TPA: DNA polymerase III subunit delta [Blastocatellia bacterium]|nr:DNA polymerase III subunit delta [Blastocatellia bacterium]
MSRYPSKKQAGLTCEQFRSRVKEGKIDPLYLFVGEEWYLHKQALQELYKTIDEAAREFNISVFAMAGSQSGTAAGSGKTLASNAIDAANSMPMISKRRIVVVRDFDKITEGEMDLVLEYLKRPADTATLVFQATSLDHRRKITEALLKTCTVVSFDPLTKHEAQARVEKYLKNKKCSIDRDALGTLLGLTGTSIARLVNELEKLVTYTGGGHISRDVVERLVPRVREHTAFELWDAILDRNRKLALQLTDRLLNDGTEPLSLIGVLASLYRRMLVAKEMIASGAESNEIARATGQYAPRAAPFYDRVRHTPKEEIVHAIRRIAQADNDLKNATGSPRLHLEYLVAELTLPESACWGLVG